MEKNKLKPVDKNTFDRAILLLPEKGNKGEESEIILKEHSIPWVKEKEVILKFKSRGIYGWSIMNVLVFNGIGRKLKVKNKLCPECGHNEYIIDKTSTKVKCTNKECGKVINIII